MVFTKYMSCLQTVFNKKEDKEGYTEEIGMKEDEFKKLDDGIIYLYSKFNVYVLSILVFVMKWKN